MSRQAKAELPCSDDKLVFYKNTIYFLSSIDLSPSKNQVLYEYCTFVSKLKHY